MGWWGVDVDYIDDSRGMMFKKKIVNDYRPYEIGKRITASRLSFCWPNVNSNKLTKIISLHRTVLL